MEITLSEILVCPCCYASLKLSAGRLVCSKENCPKKFPVKQGVPILLPSGFNELQDSAFKKAQVEFFDNWSSGQRGRRGPTKTPFDRFFSPVVGEKKIGYSEDEMRRLIERLPKNSLVLELGCGAGEHTAFLARLRDDLRFVAVDLSFKSLVETRERLEREKIKTPVSFVVADAESLPFRKGAFAGIVAVMFFHHLSHLEKTVEEMGRTLHPAGTGLIVDLVANNPCIVWTRKVFPYLPHRLKKRFKGGYLSKSGKMPEVFPHQIKEITRVVRKAGLKIIREERHDLFLLALSPLGTAFPVIKYFFPDFVLDFLYSVERTLLKNRFFQKLAGAVVLWISH